MINKQKIEVQKIEPDKARNVSVSIKLSKSESSFLRENKISPTGLFREAMREVGYKEE